MNEDIAQIHASGRGGGLEVNRHFLFKLAIDQNYAARGVRRGRDSSSFGDGNSVLGGRLITSPIQSSRLVIVNVTVENPSTPHYNVTHLYTLCILYICMFVLRVLILVSYLFIMRQNQTWKKHSDKEQSSVEVVLRLGQVRAQYCSLLVSIVAS